MQRTDRAPFAFAGIWQDTLRSNGELVPAVAILTTRAQGLAASVHDRMPLILGAGMRVPWLDPQARYRDLLEPDVAALGLFPVSERVNSAKNDDPACAEPAAKPSA